MQWPDLTTTIIGGLVVAFLSWAVNRFWMRRRIPVGMHKHVTRGGYIRSVLAVSQSEDVDALDVMWPNLKPARGDERLGRIQRAWAEINGRGDRPGVRVLVHPTQENLTAGAELAALGISVRVPVSPGPRPGDLSYHNFSPADRYGVVVNQRDRRGDRPNRLPGETTAKVFRTHFDAEWAKAEQLESALAGEVLHGIGPQDGIDVIKARTRQVVNRYRLAPVVEQAVIRHVAFRHHAPVVFVTGLPGAGKSRVRALLAQRLTAQGFQVNEQSDYLYAFHDLLYKVMLMGGRGEGFTPHPNGAFQVDDERSLDPALEALARQVWQGRGKPTVTLVEFARSNLPVALAKFGPEVLASACVLHITADPTTRAERLSKRAEPPRVSISGRDILLRPSDDHSLPSAAANALYSVDGLVKLRGMAALRGRVHHVDNDGDSDQLGARVEAFIDGVVRPYQRVA